MKTSRTIIITINIFALFLASHAFALPMKGDYVYMENDWDVPYTMTVNGASYASFCLESDVFFTPGKKYMVDSVGDDVTGGGGGAVGGNDPLERETKWLYAAFASNINSAKFTATKVQNAIWWLEDERAGVKSDWEDLKNYDFDDTGWNVVAVNISLNGVEKQSQLIGTAPVPEPATMILFGVGLLGLASVRLRRKK